MCHRIYNWNIADCDVKQPIHSLTCKNNVQDQK